MYVLVDVDLCASPCVPAGDQCEILGQSDASNSRNRPRSTIGPGLHRHACRLRFQISRELLLVFWLIFSVMSLRIQKPFFQKNISFPENGLKTMILGTLFLQKSVKQD